MSNTSFLDINHVDTANLSMITGVEQAQFPLSNIKHDFTTKVFRGTGATVEILLDLGQATDIDTFAMVGSSEDGIGVTDVKIYGSATTNFAGSTEHVIDISNEHNFGFKVFDTETHRYWRITMTAASYCELSNIYLGKRTLLPNNGIDTKSFGYTTKDNSKISKNKYNQKFVDIYNEVKIISGKISLINSTEFDTLQLIYSSHKKRKPLFFMLDPLANMPESDSEYLYSGFFYFGKEFAYKMRAPGIYDMGLILEEAK